MGRAVDVEPVLGVGLVFANVVAHLGMEDLGAAARHAAQAGIDQVLQDLAQRLFGQVLEPIDLDAGPALEVQLGIGLVQDANDVDVPLVRHLVMQAADDVHLGAAVLDRLAAALQDLLVAHHVPFRVAQIGAESAEDAAVDADVRRIQMRIDVVIREVAVLALADDVGQFAQGVQVDFGPIQEQPVVERQPLAGQHFIANRFQSGLVGVDHELA